MIKVVSSLKMVSNGWFFVNLFVEVIIIIVIENDVDMI